MKLSKFLLAMLVSFGLFATSVNAADLEIPNDFGEEGYHVYVIHRNRFEPDGSQYYTYHFFIEEDSWRNLWTDVVGDDNDFFDLAAPHQFIVRIRDDFDADYFPNYNDEDNTLRYQVDSAANIPFAFLRLVQLPIENPVYANFHNIFHNILYPYVVMEVE